MKKGAFTGALARKIGRFELADGGTIFLDEIGDISLELQVKLLRVLQEGEFDRLGSARSSRLMRASSLQQTAIWEKRSSRVFREDLYYRLNVFPITIPALRDHKDDIPILVNHFLSKYSKKIGRQVRTIPKQVIDTLMAYDWPGNIRELENIIERSMILTRGNRLEIKGLPPKKTISSNELLGITLDDIQRKHIIHALETTGWRVSGAKGAARILGINPKTLESRMKKLGVQRYRKIS